MRKLRHIISSILRFILIFKYELMGVEFESKKGVFISLSSWLDVRRGKIIVEEGVAITRSVIVLSHDATAVRIDSNNVGEYVTVLKKNSFIGMASIIMPGVVVGENSIVGAGSVVVNDVPENTIVAGNPAKVIKVYDEKTKSWRKVM